MPVTNNVDTLQKAAYALEGKFDGTALICQGRKVSFAEFDKTTDHIAKALAEEGIGPGSVVELFMERSEKMMMAIYGIIKSGAVLLPINRDIPEKRRDLIHSDISIKLSFDDEKYERIIKKELPVEAKALFAKPSDAAVILYTSGSTGTPKGVIHSQSSKLFSLEQFPGHVIKTGIACNRTDAVIAKTSVTFVSSYVCEILFAPFAGIPMIVLTDSEVSDIKAVGRAISEYPNSNVFMTPSQVVNFLGDETFREQFKKLGNLIVGGERLKPEARDIILKNVEKNTTIVNCYGSTERHIMAVGDVRCKDAVNMEILPGIDLKIIDDEGRVCAASEPGEIVLRSPCELTGYTNAELKEIKVEGKVYYGTGDKGVLSKDGKLCILGRKDRMIKYHGLRIEPGDIENNMCEYPHIRDCAVVVGKAESGHEQLLLYYTSDTQLNPDLLRSFLSGRISENMIPVGFIRLDSLPVDQRGKIDFGNLAERIYMPFSDSESAYSDTASTDEERLVCEVASAVFREKEISPAVNLFKIGLESLMAFRMIGLFKEKGYGVSISDIFAHPVLGDLAKVIRKEDKRKSIDEGEEESPAFVATGPQIYWGTDITPEKKMRGMYVTSTFICEMAYDEVSFRDRCDLIISKHPAIRTSIITEEGSMPMQKIKEKANLMAAFFDLSDMRDGEENLFEPTKAQLEYIENEKNRILSEIIENPDVIDLQAACFRISEAASFIMITGNHISVDGTSMNVLMQEFSQKDLDGNGDSYLAYLKYISSKNSMGQAIAFFGDYLKDAEFSSLPGIEKDDDEDVPPDFRSIPYHFSKEQTKSFDKKSVEFGISAVGYMIYIYGQALLKVLGKDALIMQMLTFGRGVPVAGVENSVGCFIETIPVVIRKTDTPTQFQNGYLQAEQYSYLLPPILWKSARGLDEPPKLAPFLISEIFPPVKTDGYFKEIAKRDYEHMVMSNFIVKEEDCYSLYLHFDAASILEESFLELSDEFIRLLEENCK